MEIFSNVKMYSAIPNYILHNSKLFAPFESVLSNENFFLVTSNSPLPNIQVVNSA